MHTIFAANVDDIMVHVSFVAEMYLLPGLRHDKRQKLNDSVHYKLLGLLASS